MLVASSDSVADVTAGLRIVCTCGRESREMGNGESLEAFGDDFVEGSSGGSLSPREMGHSE